MDLGRTLRAILWVNWTGSPWRDLPLELGPWQTAANRFYRWRRAGLWKRVLDLVQAEIYGAGKLDWTLHQIDSTIVRAHQHTAGGKGVPAQALGRSRSGFSTKAHLRGDRDGHLLAMLQSPGKAADQQTLPPLMEAADRAVPISLEDVDLGPAAAHRRQSLVAGRSHLARHANRVHGRRCRTSPAHPALRKDRRILPGLPLATIISGMGTGGARTCQLRAGINHRPRRLPLQGPSHRKRNPE